MKRIFVLLLVSILALSTNTSCSSDSSASPSSLVGTYSIQENGSRDEFLRIRQSGETFSISAKNGGRWQSDDSVSPVDEKQLNSLLDGSEEGVITALGNESIALFKVTEGWSNKGFTCNTGYWAATFLGPVELHKD